MLQPLKIHVGCLVSLTPVVLLGAALPIPPQTFRAASDLVVLQVAVQDGGGRVVTDLPASAFRIWEDGVPQAIRFFINEDRPVAIGLVVDNSTSMRSKRREVGEAAEAFARASHPADELFLVDFNEHVWLGLPEGVAFTSDRQILHDALAATRAEGQTALYDAVAVGLEHLKASALDEHVLVVVSDGADNRSRRRLPQILEAATGSSARIYTVGIFDDVEGGDRKLLRRLAEATGGLPFFPETLRDVRGALDRIAIDVRQRYTMGYVPSNGRRDGSFRTLKVSAADPRNGKTLQVRARNGYRAPSDSGRMSPDPTLSPEFTYRPDRSLN